MHSWAQRAATACFMAHRLTSTARNDTPLIVKHQAAPTAARSRPPSPGPITRALLNISEFRAIAFGRSSRPTMSTTKACRAGASKALTNPSPAARRMICHTRTTPVNVSTARMNASSIAPLWVIISSQRLGTRSTTTPPHGVTNSDGMAEAKPTMPSMRSGVAQLPHQPALCHRLHPGARIRNELPAKVELVVAMLERRKCACRSLGGAACHGTGEWIVWTDFMAQELPSDGRSARESAVVHRFYAGVRRALPLYMSVAPSSLGAPTPAHDFHARKEKASAQRRAFLSPTAGPKAAGFPQPAAYSSSAWRSSSDRLRRAPG